MTTHILGISAFYHDSAACILRDSEIVAAAQEERFTRVKHDSRFPVNAIQYCVKEAGIEPSAIDYVVFYEKPLIKFERLLETYLAFAPQGLRSFVQAMPIWIQEKLFQKSILVNELSSVLGEGVQWLERLLFSEHHYSHAASAFYPSPYQRAAILTLDGVGEWTTTSMAVGQDNQIEIIKDIHFPHSLGLLYSAFTYYLGFKVNSGEYKVMGLAPYGEPKYADKIRAKLIAINDDGSYWLNMKYFNYCTGLTMTNKKFHALFGGPPRQPESDLTQREMDLAASIQCVIEEVIVKLAKSAAKETGERNLCLAGGVALNCVANGILLREKIFDNVWIQPAAGDAGGALGAALAAYHMHCGGSRPEPNGHDKMRGALLGPRYTDEEIKAALNECGAMYHQLSEPSLIDAVVESLLAGKAVGWMQGRMEFGPRALGNRSIIADPRSPTMQKTLNLKIKYRESFRPFAPSVLRENVADWFEHNEDSPYMLFVAQVNEDKRQKADGDGGPLPTKNDINAQRSSIPAVTHIDYSARVQTVHKNTNAKFHLLIERFHELTGCPLVVNTSFNVRGEPIVCTPQDAYRCFMGTELDTLAIGNFFLVKEEQSDSAEYQYADSYDLD